MDELIHICWGQMDESTICVRLDNAAQGGEYRMSLDGECWTGPSEDGLYRFPGVESCQRYTISCQRCGEEGWAEACPPVTMNFVPPAPSHTPLTRAMARPKCGGADEACQNACLGTVFALEDEP